VYNSTLASGVICVLLYGGSWLCSEVGCAIFALVKLFMFRILLIVVYFIYWKIILQFANS
jgi:hypothetical protein